MPLRRSLFSFAHAFMRRRRSSGMSRSRRRLRPRPGSTRTSTGRGSHVTRTTFRPCRHHRRGPRHRDGVLRRAGARSRGHADVRGGEFLDTVIGIPESRTEIVMLRPPDGGTRLELSSFVRPDHAPGSPAAMATELGLRNVAFEVDDLQAAVDGLAADGTGWSAASASPSTSGGWPTCAVRRGSSRPWPSRSADTPLDVRSCRDQRA